MRTRAVVAVVLVGCASNPGNPAYPTTRPAPLATVGAPRASETVRIEMKQLPWWTLAGTNERFIVKLDDDAETTTRGRILGPVRTRDVVLASDVFAAVACAWQIVPMGDPRPCGNTTREEAMAIAKDAIDEARAELRARAGDAGAGVVTDVRCFAESRREAHLWCEGTALAVDAAPNGSDPAAPRSTTVPFASTRFLLVADGSVGMLADRPIVGSTIGFRFRPFELGFYILDLGRKSVSPSEDGQVGLGLTLVGRFAIGRSRADAIAGVSAVAAFQNGATNPDFDGLYHGFVGLAYQSSWRIGGAAQPFAQLRAGVASGQAIGNEAVPMLELHLGMSSPERR
ncbi:MAG: hypothetical protein H0T46_14410 [Deltaproteobacteria bacterium]|nr:hypothetical protein [Deltaproteobacteria bacterium]